MSQVYHCSYAVVIPLLALLLWVSPSLAHKPTAPAEPQYTVTDLGAGIATDIDPVTNQMVGARLVGEGQQEQIAVRLGVADGLLGTLPEGVFSFANSIRQALEGGVRIVGYSGTGPFSLRTHAWVLTIEDGNPTLALVDLETSEGETHASFATSVNASGLVCGYRDADDPVVIEPGCWPDGPGSFEALPTLGGPNGMVEVINAQGDKCGNTETADGDDHATCWFGDDPPVDLQEGVEGIFSLVFALNEDRKAGGLINGPDGVLGFVWTQADGLQTIPPLPGDVQSSIRGLNNAGDAVGDSSHADPAPPVIARHPILVRDGTTEAINLLEHIDTDLDCTLETAIGISDDGHIVVNGRCEDGDHAFLLTPTDSVVTPPKEPKKKHRRHDALAQLEDGLRRCGKLDRSVLAALAARHPLLVQKLMARAALMQ